MAVEYIQRECCNEGIAHTVLLIEVALDSARLLIPPGSPFVNEEGYLLLWISLVHDSLVLLDDIFYAERLAHGPVVILIVELGGRTLAA